MPLQRWPGITTADGALAVGAAEWLSWWLVRVEGSEDLEPLILSVFPDMQPSGVQGLIALALAARAAGVAATALPEGGELPLDVVPIDPTITAPGVDVRIRISEVPEDPFKVLPVEITTDIPPGRTMQDLIDEITAEITKAISDAWRDFREQTKEIGPETTMLESSLRPVGLGPAALTALVGATPETIVWDVWRSPTTTSTHITR